MPLITQLKAGAKEEEEATRRLVSGSGSSVGQSVVRSVKDIEKGCALKSSRLTDTCQGPVGLGSNAAKYIKRKSVNKTRNGPNVHSFNVASGPSGRSADLKVAEKPVSLAIQAKLNVQKRLARNPSDSYEVQGGVISCQSSVHEKCPTDYPSRVLTPSISGQHASSDDVTGYSTIGYRKKGKESTYDGKNAMHCNTKNVPGKKHIREEGARPDKNSKGNFYLNDECAQRNKSNLSGDSHRKNEIDDVSFSVTTPMKGLLSGSKYCNQMIQETKEHCTDRRCERALFDSNSTKSPSSHGLSVNVKDALRNLLEQKPREVTNGVEFRGVGYLESDSATSHSSPIQLTLPSINGLTNSSHLSDKPSPDEDRSQLSSDFSSNVSLKLRRGFKFEATEYQGSPVSILEPAFSESCNSSNSSSYYSHNTEGTLGSNECSSSSLPVQEAHSLDCMKKSYSVEADTDLLDSASSAPITTLTRNHTYRLGVTRSIGPSTNWELEYVKKMLKILELGFNSFALGECLDIRCKRYIGGGFKSWANGKIMVRGNARLAEELCRDISKWQKMGDCMVDELVGEDLSCRYGRWAGFETEAFQIGVEIQERIFYTLVTEVVRDILLR